MKNMWLKFSLAVMCILTILGSCKKDTDVPAPNPPGNSGGTTVTALKDAADFPIGVAVSSQLITDPAYAAVVKRDFDAVTFEYQMKHGAIVQSNGTLNFTNADALVAAAGSMDVFGHTLLWHQNQNAAYLRNFTGITLAAGPELLSNGGFENGLTGWSVFNTGNPAGTSTLAATNLAGDARSGTGALKVVNPTAYPGNPWRVQFSSGNVTTTAGAQYTISFWVKAAAPAGSIRLSSGPTAPQYQGNQIIGTTYQQISWTITASLPATTFLFDLGEVANTYYIDDVSIKEVLSTQSGPQVAAKVDEAMGTFITGTVNRYKNKVKAWDVVNEPFTDFPVALRNNGNTPIAPADVFIWSHYLGRDAALKAFNYARAADPTADLYMNDYNLESSNAKLDSIIAFVAELRAKGAKIDGIGTQVHTSTTANTTGIDNMMKKLAATGLKVRVSELDVRTSTSGDNAKALAIDQPAIYKYIVQSYLRNVPAPQRGGLTIWGVNDKNSWLYNNGAELPLLYDDAYNKKAAYGAVLQALLGR